MGQAGCTSSSAAVAHPVSKHRKNSLDEVQERVEARTGRLSLSGRYHREPKRVSDDYHLTGTVLGSGCNGNVLLATGKGAKHHRKYAVKVLNLANVTGQQLGELESELEIFLSMDHPHIVRLVDVFETQSTLSLVMECMEGGELFDRLIEIKKFSECAAAGAINQMLLAVNYMHSLGVLHGDLKPENFLYESKDSDHLKLIDFGFSMLLPGADAALDLTKNSQLGCTLSYAAPEVFNKSFTSQCDLWSVGVIGFMLISGRMPFGGDPPKQIADIRAGRFSLSTSIWAGVSDDAKAFVSGLLTVNPTDRLTAVAALEHRWITTRTESPREIDADVVDGLRQFARASRFRKACLSMIAWSLTNEERREVRQHFLHLDRSKEGTITLCELQKALCELPGVMAQKEGEEVEQIFAALDSNSDERIHYSDFLAAMVSSRIALHDDLMRDAFNRFDTDRSGYITAANLREVLGDGCEGVGDQGAEGLIAEADFKCDRRISYPEFVKYMKGASALDSSDAPVAADASSRRPSTKRVRNAHAPAHGGCAWYPRMHRALGRGGVPRTASGTPA